MQDFHRQQDAHDELNRFKNNYSEKRFFELCEMVVNHRGKLNG